MPEQMGEAPAPTEGVDSEPASETAEWGTAPLSSAHMGIWGGGCKVQTPADREAGRAEDQRRLPVLRSLRPACLSLGHPARQPPQPAPFLGSLPGREATQSSLHAPTAAGDLRPCLCPALPHPWPSCSRANIPRQMPPATPCSSPFHGTQLPRGETCPSGLRPTSLPVLSSSHPSLHPPTLLTDGSFLPSGFNPGSTT